MSALSAFPGTEMRPLGWPFQVYNCFTLLLSGIIIFFEFLLHELSREASSVLPHAFRRISLGKQRRLFCFEVDISGSSLGRKVRMQYVWALRTTILVVSCYVWQTCVLSFWTIEFTGNVRSSEHLLLSCAARRADCFGVMHNYDFFSVNAAPENLCLNYPDLEQQLQDPDFHHSFTQKFRYITCVRFVKPDTIAVTQHLAIAFALSNMILALFELLVWLLYRSKNSLLPSAVLLVGLLFLAVWVGSIFIPKLLTFLSSWIGYVMLLATPVILWTALLAAHYLRKIQHQKLALWQQQANRPMAETEDHYREILALSSFASMYNPSKADDKYKRTYNGTAALFPGAAVTNKQAFGKPAALTPFLARFQKRQEEQEHLKNTELYSSKQQENSLAEGATAVSAAAPSAVPVPVLTSSTALNSPAATRTPAASAVTTAYGADDTAPCTAPAGAASPATVGGGMKGAAAAMAAAAVAPPRKAVHYAGAAVAAAGSAVKGVAARVRGAEGAVRFNMSDNTDS